MKFKTMNFEKVEGTAIYFQIYQKIRDDILSGYLEQHDRLPSIRNCEKLMKASKTSIERAYAQLVEEGYIRSIPQIGYYVDVDEERVRLRKGIMIKDDTTTNEIIRYDLRSQTMDINSFDLTLWKKYLKEVLDMPNDIASYGNAQGEVSLRLALQRYAYSVRGVLCSLPQMLIGSSFQSLLYILCGLLAKDSVIGMEERGFSQAEQVFQDYGFKVRKLSMECDGISLTDLYASDIHILYLNSVSVGSNYQPIKKAKREELLRWAKDKSAFIIEDDHNGELRYHSKITPAIQGFDLGNHVIYIGSFSKLLLPSLRISYMVFTNQLQERYDEHKENYGPTASKIEQLALARYITDGHLERHVRRLRKTYEAKSHAMLVILHKTFPKASFILEEAALHIIIRFPKHLDVDACIHLAKEKQILIQKNNMQELVVSFVAVREEEMEGAILELKELWKNMFDEV